MVDERFCAAGVPVIHTVELSIHVPSQRDSRGHWRWVPAAGLDPAGSETALNRRELEMILSVYGDWCAGYFLGAGPDRYRVQAWGLLSLRVEGLYVWMWSAAAGRYLPAGEAWAVWDATSDGIARKAAGSPP